MIEGNPLVRWFKDLNITPRFLLIFSVLMSIATGMVFQAINVFRHANDRVSALYHDDVTGAMNITDINYARAMVGRDIRDAMLHINDPAIVAEDRKVALAELDSMKADIDAGESGASSKDIKDALALLRTSFPSYDQGCREVFRLIEANDLSGAVALLTSVSSSAKPIYEAAARAVELTKHDAQDKFEANDASYRSTRAVMIWVIFVSVAGGLVMTVFVARGFATPMNKAVFALEKVAKGDMTVTLQIGSKDEVGRMAAALNETVARLRSTLEEVNEGALTVSSSSRQLATSADAIASGAQEQAASLEETSASLEEITATVRQTADNARQASQLASGSWNSAAQGQDVVAKAITAMGEINASSAKISEIISTIDEIAFQTNLLAVNAAVEAARAGDEGRGFGVVAAEVRTLAQRSSEAAKQIKILIEDSLRKVERGTNLVNNSGETLQSIVMSVKRVTDIVSEIAAAAGEQSAGIEQVNSAMMQMDQITQSNSEQTEELSSTAGALADQSEKLTELVSVFTLSKSGKDARVTATANPNTAVAIRTSVTARTESKVSVASTVKGKRHNRASAATRQPVAARVATFEDNGSFEEF
jgi:methyl-accepting chemotaxis protein